jgi:hypothetical protein
LLVTIGFSLPEFIASLEITLHDATVGVPGSASVFPIAQQFVAAGRFGYPTAKVFQATAIVVGSNNSLPIEAQADTGITFTRDVTHVVRWDSLDHSIATVSNFAHSQGLAVGKGAGKTTITAAFIDVLVTEATANLDVVAA